MNDSNPKVTVEQTKRIRSLSLDRDELRQLLVLLQNRSSSAGDIEVLNFQKRDQSEAIFEANKRVLKDGFILFVTITGNDGVNLYGNIETVFSSPDFPTEVASVFFDTSIPLRNPPHNYIPRNKCVLFLDFSRPEIFNFTFLPSQETRNESNLLVQGNDATWVHGLYHELEKYFSSHPSTLRILHRHTTYDILVWICGLPLGFWLCFRMSRYVSALTSSPFVSAALFTYLFFVSLICLRILFHYSRWIWPLVEYRGPKNKAIKHKLFLGALAFGLLTSLVYDLLKAIPQVVSHP